MIQGADDGRGRGAAAQRQLDGPSTFTLLQASFSREARKIPALAARGSWASDDLDDLFGEFVAAKLADLTEGLVAAATTETAVGNQARKIAKH